MGIFLSEQETEDLKRLTNSLRDELDFIEHQAQEEWREEAKRSEILEELFDLEMIDTPPAAGFEDPYGDRFLTDENPPY